MMLPGVLPAVDAHYVEMQRLEAVAVLATRRAWDRVEPSDISASWLSAARPLLPALANVQLMAAREGASYVDVALRQQGTPVSAEAAVRPGAWPGWSSAGLPLERVLYSPVIRTKEWIGQGMAPRQAMEAGGRLLDTIARTEIAEVGRDAAGVDIATRPDTGWVRMINPPTCSRCLILAGRWYRYNEGFDRHPNDDCVHVPARENVAGDLTTDPRRYFDSLPEAGQDRLFGRDNAQAIRDGADMSRVENLRMPKRFATDARARLTPRDIYTRAGSRGEAIRLLRINGYLA